MQLQSKIRCHFPSRQVEQDPTEFFPHPHTTPRVHCNCGGVRYCSVWWWWAVLGRRQWWCGYQESLGLAAPVLDSTAVLAGGAGQIFRDLHKPFVTRQPAAAPAQLQLCSWAGVNYPKTLLPQRSTWGMNAILHMKKENCIFTH